MSDRLLAFAVMDSIERTTGHAPYKVRIPWGSLLLLAVVIGCPLAMALFGA